MINSYELDFDEKGMLSFTEKNLALISACIKIDSAYRNAFDPNYQGSSAYLIKNKFPTDDKKVMREICLAIDKENSTHLAVSGLQKGDNQGVDLMVQKIMSISNLTERLMNGDPELVNEISFAVPNVHKFSFASKFCTFICRHRFESKYQDNYAIYDNVVKDILPYYAWKYLKKKCIRRRQSNVDVFEKENNYEGYRNLIDDIRNQIKATKQLEISRENFDQMLWYYYKGDKSRIRVALELVGK